VTRATNSRMAHSSEDDIRQVLLALVLTTEHAREQRG
jgi:hypothetical protein